MNPFLVLAFVAVIVGYPGVGAALVAAGLVVLLLGIG